MNMQSKLPARWRHLGYFFLLVAFLVSIGCSKDRPSEPVPNETTVPVATYNVTVALSQNSIEANSPNTVNVTVTVRHAGNGNPPPRGTKAVVTTTMGGFISGTEQFQRIEVELPDNGQITLALSPGAAAGRAVIDALVQGARGRNELQITGGQVFSLNRVDPNRGSPNGGEAIRIYGSGFVSPVTVKFDGVDARVLGVTPTQIRVEVPGLPNGSLPGGGTELAVDVSVSNGSGGTQTLTDAFFYSELGSASDKPRIFSIDPNSGPTAGGNQVTIRGDGFVQPLRIEFQSGPDLSSAAGAGAEAQLVSFSPTELVVIAPRVTTMNGAGDVRVTNVETGRFGVFTDGYTFTDIEVFSVSPSQGPAAGGTQVTIFGSGFTEPLEVKFGGAIATVVSVTSDQIVAVTGPATLTSCADFTTPVTVTQLTAGVSGTGGAFTYLVSMPTVTSISPSSGSQNGGANLTITGTDLGQVQEVRFGDGGSTFGTSNASNATSTTVNVVTPSAPDSFFDTVSCTIAGGGSGTQAVNTTATVSVVDSATTCTASGTFTYSPSNPTCQAGGGGGGTGGACAVADFTATVDPVTSMVTFTDQSTGDIGSYFWDYDDGNTSTVMGTNTYTYAAPGTYSVTLVVTYSGPSGGTCPGSSMDSQAVVVP